jgi:hypothetical protein
MDVLKPSMLMGKLEELLPNKFSRDDDLFLSMFFIRLLPSVREAVEDALWDAHGGGDPTVATAMASHSRRLGDRGRQKG